MHAPADPNEASQGRSRWLDDADVPRGQDYDERFARLAASGVDVHGEAALVASLAPGPRVLDAGCGTGRVALELHQRGFEVAGVDLDPAMLSVPRERAPELPWIEADLSALALDQRFDVIVAAGNVLIFVAPGTERAVVARLAAHLDPGGLLVCGFTVRRGGYGPDRLDADARAAGLSLAARWSTWERDPWQPGGDYQVSVHRLGPPDAG